MLEDGFVYRPQTVEDTTSWSAMPALQVGENDGIDLEVAVTAVAGTGSPTLYLKVETSLDGVDWEDSEGVIEFTGPAVLVVRRLNLYEWVRVSQKLTGTTPTATYGIRAAWVQAADYPTITAQFDGQPQQGGTAYFSGTTGIPGAKADWEIVYIPGGTYSGKLTADNDGNYSGSCEVPIDATQADLTVNSLGQEATDSTDVGGGG